VSHAYKHQHNKTLNTQKWLRYLTKTKFLNNWSGSMFHRIQEFFFGGQSARYRPETSATAQWHSRNVVLLRSLETGGAIFSDQPNRMKRVEKNYDELAAKNRSQKKWKPANGWVERSSTFKGNYCSQTM
jgi:hypothetical protein